MTNVDFLIKEFEKASLLSKGTRIQKLKKVPIKQLFLKILKFIALRLKKPIRINAKTFWGEDMIVVFPEKVSLSIYPYGLFEEDVTRMILEHVKPGMTFLDIGAHFGFNTLLASAIVGNAGQVHSFEPTPSTFEMLRLNTKNRKNIYINNMAVFSTQKTISFNDYGLIFSAFNSIYPPRLRESALKTMEVKNYEIRAISVDEYIDSNKIAPDFIKIDAESAEYDILCGMETTLSHLRPIIVLEVGDIDSSNIVRTKDVISYLANKGYQPYEVKERSIVKHELKDRYDGHGCANILFRPKP